LPFLTSCLSHLSVSCVNKMISISSISPPQLHKKNEKTLKNTIIINKNDRTEKSKNKKNTENNFFNNENAGETKIKKSILNLISDLCVITGEYGGYLDGCVGLCVWHIAPLLSQHEVV
jgi:hypothetical protein